MEQGAGGAGQRGARGGGKLPSVQTKREFRECLEGWTRPPGGGRPGRRRAGLWSYVLETNGGVEAEGSSGGARWSVRDTGVDGLKILRVERGGAAHEAFMDASDGRFYVLHTREAPRTASGMVDALTDAWASPVDRMWLHSGMLEAVRKMGGSSLGAPRAGRPGGPRSARCDVTHAGRFAMGRGGSVTDYLDLVGMSKDAYSGVVAGIEKCWLGPRRVSGKDIVGGRTLDFTFGTPIRDLRRFIGGVFNTGRPFSLWGLESRLECCYFDVLGVDLHAAGSIDFEITRDFMRVYLSKGSCGNTVLRLLTHLELCHGAGWVACKQVDRLVC